MDFGTPHAAWRDYVALASIASSALLFVLAAPLLARERDHLLPGAAAATVGIGALAFVWAYPDPEFLLPLLGALAALGGPVAAAAGVAWKIERIGRPRHPALRSALAAMAFLAGGAASLAAVAWVVQRFGV